MTSVGNNWDYVVTLTEEQVIKKEYFPPFVISSTSEINFMTKPFSWVPTPIIFDFQLKHDLFEVLKSMYGHKAVMPEEILIPDWHSWATTFLSQAVVSCRVSQKKFAIFVFGDSGLSSKCEASATRKNECLYHWFVHPCCRGIPLAAEPRIFKKV